MKRIAYTQPDGSLAVVTPSAGARLASRITLRDGRVLTAKGGGLPADSCARGWPIEGATAEWAETEDEFVARIAAKDVPADALNVHVVDEP